MPDHRDHPLHRITSSGRELVMPAVCCTALYGPTCCLIERLRQNVSYCISKPEQASCEYDRLAGAAGRGPDLRT
jgi:hypothetical protein